jgi:glycosyltransferase involved in cell wall biosynthesis
VAAPYETKEYQGVKIHRLHKVSNKWLRKLFFDYWNPFNVFRIRKILKGVKPDVVHFHNFYGIGSWLAAYTSKRIPTIITAHDYWPFCYWASLMYDFAPCDYCEGAHPQFKLRNFFHWLHTKINKKFFRRCKFVSPSKYMNTKINEIGKFTNTEWLPYGIDSPPSISSYDKIILWVGRLTIEKGFDRVAPELNKVKSKYPGWRVLVLGDGPMKTALQSQFKNIEFLGYQNPHQFYKDASMLVMSSVWPDNLPFSVLESMAMGLCVLSPPVGGIPEMVAHGRSGYLFEDKKELHNFLKELINNPTLIKQFGISAKNIIEDKFSFDKCINSHNGIYKKTIGN